MGTPLESKDNLSIIKLRGKSISEGERIATPEEREQIACWIKELNSKNFGRENAHCDSEVIMYLKKGGQTTFRASLEIDYIEIRMNIENENVHFRDKHIEFYNFICKLN